ncbi:hypothetical protein VULLAG_LOCUS12698 [Vulpes lagopus]
MSWAEGGCQTAEPPRDPPSYSFKSLINVFHLCVFEATFVKSCTSRLTVEDNLKSEENFGPEKPVWSIAGPGGLMQALAPGEVLPQPTESMRSAPSPGPTPSACAPAPPPHPPCPEPAGTSTSCKPLDGQLRAEGREGEHRFPTGWPGGPGSHVGPLGDRSSWAGIWGTRHCAKATCTEHLLHCWGGGGGSSTW